MHSRPFTIVAIGALIFEAAMGAYLTAFAWVGSAWMADDSWAFRASDSDWIRAALVRFGGWCLVAGFVAVAVWALNRWLAAKGAKIAPWVPQLAAAVIGVAIVIASAIGSVQFATERPWL